MLPVPSLGPPPILSGRNWTIGAPPPAPSLGAPAPTHTWPQALHGSLPTALARMPSAVASYPTPAVSMRTLTAPSSAPPVSSAPLAYPRSNGSMRPAASPSKGSLHALGGSPQSPSSLDAWADPQLLVKEEPDLKVEASKEDAELKEQFNRIDKNCSGVLSLLEFVTAMQNDKDFASLVLPGVDCTNAMNDPDTFDAIHAVFSTISLGKTRIDFTHFKLHMRGEDAALHKITDESKAIFALIDKNRKGMVSKVDLVNAMQDAKVLNFVLPGHNSSLNDEDKFDAIDAVFDAIAKNKNRFEIADFTEYFCTLVPSPSAKVRRGQRVLIIGPGFGSKINPRQTAIVMEAGFQVHFVYDLPNPEVPNFPMMSHLPQLKAAMDEFRPDIVIAASKGGAYLIALWTTGLWRGASLLLNPHPYFVQVPKNMNVVLACGSNDEVYFQRSRSDLEKLMATGTPNKTFFYYTADSGALASGQKTRQGDQHNMGSLIAYNCLPRLIDAALDRTCPEMSMIRSWQDRLSEERVKAEQMLGLLPEKLRRYWASSGKKGLDERKLFDVAINSEEYKSVLTLFKSEPKEEAAYCGSNYALWERRPVLKVQRVENGRQADQCAPYLDSVRGSITDQGLAFEPGIHTRWCFHGAATDAIESIVNGTVTGFQPLAGTRGALLWGAGTYFARDAKYVAEGGFAKPTANGQYQMLLCLTITGIPCLGGPMQHGVLPFRTGTHRYHSTVDALSSPEIFIVQRGTAAYPAYLITFA